MKPFAMPKLNLKLCTSASFLALLIFVLLFSLSALAAEGPDTTIETKGLVQCTGPGGLCTLCDLYSGTRRVINYMLFYLVLPLSVIVFIASGIFFLTSAGSEERVTRAKNILWYGVLGLLLAFSAWVIVNTILTTLGFKGNWASFATCATAPFGPGAPGVAERPPIQPPVTKPPPVLPPGTRSHEIAVEFLKGAGIAVVSSPNGYTSLEGIPSEALAKIWTAKRDCERTLPKCSFVISGGTETAGHGATTEHGVGKGAVDIQSKDIKTYALLKAFFLNRINPGGRVQCEAKGNEKGISCDGSEGPVNHLHVSGL